MYAYINTYTYTSIYTYRCTYRYIYLYIHTYMYTLIHTCVHKYTHVCIYILICTYTELHALTYTYAPTHTRMILNMKHVCTRVHVPRGSPLSTDLGVSENRGPQYNSTLNSRILINKDPSQNRVPLIFGNSPFFSE